MTHLRALNATHQHWQLCGWFIPATTPQVTATADRDRLAFELQQTAQKLVSSHSSLLAAQAAFRVADSELTATTLQLHHTTAEAAARGRRLDAAVAESAVRPSSTRNSRTVSL
jgi:hypothetical protein